MTSPAPPSGPDGVRRFWHALRRRVRDIFDRVLRFFGREPAAGHFESGSAASWRGFVTVAPIVPPEREYLVYVPRGYHRWRRAPLLVLCHGCRQTPEDIAGLASITALADREGTLVLMPRQNDLANRYRCWNWFDTHTASGAGEAAIVASQIVAVRRRYRARRERVWIAGLSAGAGLAAVMGVRYPRLVRGVLCHSGLACGAASRATAALAVMKQGPDNDVARLAEPLIQRDTQEHVPLLVIQGDRDDVVAPINAKALVVQYLHLNGHAAGNAGYVPDAPLPPADSTKRVEAIDRYPMQIDDWTIDGRVVVRNVLVEGLGHAWSGGNALHDFADPKGPDAIELFAAFAREAAN